MRKIGEVSNTSHRERLARFLASQGIDCRIDARDTTGDVWILDEDRIPEAKQWLTDFLRDPEASRFDAPAERPTRDRQVVRTIRVPRPASGIMPLTFTLIAISVAVSLMTSFGKQRPELLSYLWLTDAWSADGEVWRVFTPMFIHLGMMHLFFNMYWLLLLGGTIERLKGTGILLGLVVAIAVVSHLSQFFFEGGRFGGMSGVVYGLFGFIWMRSSLLPWEGFFMPKDTAMIMIGWAVLCLTGMLGPVANTAHFAGLFMGMLCGAWPRLVRDL